jgi:hypothetical protein
MSKKRWLDTSFWSDPWVVDSLNILDRHLFIYFITNEHTNVAGVYEIAMRTICNETGLEKEEVARIMVRLEPRVKYIDGWLVLRNGIKNQNYRNSKIEAAILSAIDKAPAEIFEYVSWPKDFKHKPEITSRQTSISYDSSMTLDETLHSDSDSDSDLDISTNVDITKPKASQTAYISKLYYQVIKALKLPVLNHNTLRAKIKQMTTEVEYDKLKEYLLFMRDNYQSVEIEFKPHINNALDIYSKRVQIENAMISAAKEQIKQENRVFRI